MRKCLNQQVRWCLEKHAEVGGFTGTDKNGDRVTTVVLPDPGTL